MNREMSDEAVIGYAMLAGKKLGLSVEQLDMLNSLVFYELDETSTDEAEIAYSKY